MSDSSAWARRSHLLGHAVALAAITILLSTAVATPAALAAPPGAGSAPCPPSHLAGALQARPADCRTPETEPLLIPEPGDPAAPARVRPATLPSARAAGAGPRPPDARRPAAPGAASTGVPRSKRPQRSVAAAPAPHQPGFGGGTAAPAGDTAPAIPVAASRDDLDARVGRSLLYSGALGLALAVIGMTMVARRRRLW